MPVEHVRLTLKPVHFFTQNPSIDVSAALDAKSKHAFGVVNGVGVANVNGTHGINGTTAVPNGACACDSE
jgi:hypothetical protein